jgi:hypothetical protein
VSSASTAAPGLGTGHGSTAGRSRTTGGRLLPPVLVGVTALAGAVLVAVLDPNRPGHYPVCPFLALTGWYCPGCGGLRAVHALLHADPAQALARNPLVVLLLPVLAVAWARWLRRAWRGVRTGQWPGWMLWAGLAVLVGFGVARNLPGAGWLAP